MSESKCPNCGGELHAVTRPSDSYLSPDQFDAVRAGDFYCMKCPSNDRGNTGYRYFWERELTSSDIRWEQFLETLDELERLGLLEEFREQNRALCDRLLVRLQGSDLHALTERLRIVEAERDTTRKAHTETMGWLVKTGIALGWKLGGDLTKLHEVASALRGELQRKDAALRRLESASVAVDKAWHYEARQGDGIMEEHEPQELELQMALIDARAALQPKEPPCQTA